MIIVGIRFQRVSLNEAIFNPNIPMLTINNKTVVTITVETIRLLGDVRYGNNEEVFRHYDTDVTSYNYRTQRCNESYCVTKVSAEQVLR